MPRRGSWSSSKATWACASWCRRQAQVLGQRQRWLAGPRARAPNACRSTAAVTSIASAQEAPQLPQPLQPPSLPPSPPKEQQRSETFSETVLVTPSGSRGHKLKRTSPGGTTRCAQYTSPAGTVPQLLQCESRAAALADVGWNEFGMNEPQKVNRGFSWHEKEDSYKYGFKNSMDFQDFQPLYAAAASVW